jgi:hypothetical protein
MGSRHGNIVARPNHAFRDNPAMSALRPARSLARLVLAWFVLALGLAVASPLVKPQSWQMVCSAAGTVKLLSIDNAGLARTSAHQMECPLCWLVAAPPPDFSLVLMPPALVSEVSLSVVPERDTARAGPPLPARGPPRIC